MRTSTRNQIEPYRVMFPIGAALAAIGAVLWVLYGLHPDRAYPSAPHAQLMIGGFLFAFASGFMMTAIPKMTASFPAKPWEISAVAAMTIVSGTLAGLQLPTLFFLSSAASLMFLISFSARRFLARKRQLPTFFAFVGCGLFCGLAGSILLFLSNEGIGSAFLLGFGQKLYFQGLILSLVLGIGCRLVPVLMGRQPMEFSVSGSGPTDRGAFQPSAAEPPVLAGLLIASFAVEAAGSVELGLLLKACVATTIAVRWWQIHKPGGTKSRLSWGVRASGLMVLAGLWLALFQPGQAVHWMHLTYIGGFGLMTLTVASRVTLAHGSYDLGFEARSKSLVICGGLVLAAALARALAPFTPAAYVSHLAYAAAIWIGAVAVWSSVFVTRMIKRAEADESSC